MINFCKAIYYPFVSDKKLNKVNVLEKNLQKKDLTFSMRFLLLKIKMVPLFKLKN